MADNQVLQGTQWQVDSSRNFDERLSLLAQSSELEDSSVTWVFTPEQWLIAKEKLNLNEINCGLRLCGDDNVEQLATDIKAFDLIVIEFPHFTDGRGFSIAAQLRERYQYQGELRASGYLLVDQLFYLKRCGFDSFVFRNPVDADKAVSALADFSVSYQAS